jgi:hypothetical protein
VSAKEAPLTGEEKANVLLRSGRLVFLQTVGYSEAQILRLGDLAALPSERMSTLLQRKAEEAIATAFGKSIQRHHPRVRKIGGRKKK